VISGPLKKIKEVNLVSEIPSTISGPCTRDTFKQYKKVSIYTDFKSEVGKVTLKNNANKAVNDNVFWNIIANEGLGYDFLNSNADEALKKCRE
jgi:hypothetical protein